MNSHLPVNWPPLITDARMPRRIVWRDRLLTLSMWGLMLFFARDIPVIVGAATLDWLGRDHNLMDIDVDIWVDELVPYVVASGVLGLWLLGWGLASLRRLRRARGMPQPPPLPIEADVERAGATQQQLEAWRDLRIAIVHLDQHGHIRVEDRRPVEHQKAEQLRL